MLGANHIPVGPMRRDELRRAIVLPAQRAGLRVDAALVDALVADVQGEPGALPLLSTALLELWQERDGQRLTFAAYERAGGVQGAVARLAERVYGELDPDERRARGRSSSGSRASARAGSPCAAACRSPSSSAAPEVLAKLADGRLVIVSGEEAEVAHEALLREWPRLRAGSRRTPRAGACITTSASPRANGTRAAATRASSTAAPGSPPPSTGRPRTTRSSTRSSARSWTRAAPRAGAPSAACAAVLAGVAGAARARGHRRAPRARAARHRPRRGDRRRRAAAGARARSPRTTSTARCCSPARASSSTTARRRAAACSPRSTRARRPSGCMRGAGERHRRRSR